MEDPKRNGLMSDSLTKRDKKRQQISSRLNKLELTFRNDRDIFYRNSLHELQTKLATLQQGNNEEFMNHRINLEEVRDYELTKLRLWEEYQVKRIEIEYNEDIARAKDNHDKMIKLIKEKLYDKLEVQIKQLKEDKMLLNLVNGNSWNESSSNNLSIPTSLGDSGFNDRRSLRKREISTRFTTGEADDLSDGATGGGAGNVSSTGPNGYNNGYTSASGKRRRLYATRYSSNDEMSSSIASASNSTVPNFRKTNAGSGGNGHHVSTGMSSGYESNLSDKDYDTLNNLIMQNEDGGASLILVEKVPNKPQTRGSNKQFSGPQGLKPEELNEDLTLLRNAIVKKE
ncbi:Transcriptional regulatory protein SDS3 [Spathaspora sp. JA1]|nr:Transcriptional regulatory protein SDS3 [Spathaspora sp. JA1]